ncbi:MAG: glycosyltransferase family 2 protein [Candidatus Omnitrophota bacterium]
MLSLIIPFYNDSGCPIPFVAELKKEFKGINYELILVDDCSSDSTPEELESLKDINVHVIYNKQNLGYGGAIITGLNRGKGDILGFTCGDGETSPKDIVRVYKNTNNFAVTKAVRINRKDGLRRKLISRVFNSLNKLRFNMLLEDINGYPFFLKKEVYNELCDLRTDWLFNIDLIGKILSKGHRINGFVIEHQKRLEGKSHVYPKNIIKMVIEYIKYRGFNEK